MQGVAQEHHFAGELYLLVQVRRVVALLAILRWGWRPVLLDDVGLGLGLLRHGLGDRLEVGRDRPSTLCSSLLRRGLVLRAGLRRHG